MGMGRFVFYVYRNFQLLVTLSRSFGMSPAPARLERSDWRSNPFA